MGYQPLNPNKYWDYLKNALKLIHIKAYYLIIFLKSEIDYQYLIDMP